MPAVDVLVVGAGPAGCVAAWEAAAAGARVLLIERDRAIGAPVRCAEGVGSAGLREFLNPDGAPWVSRRVSRMIFVSPDGTEAPLVEQDIGYVLDRTRFEPALAEQASRAGAAIRIGTEAVGLERTDGGVPDAGWRVRLHGPGGAETVAARVVIGADGVETMVGRWAGLETRVASRDMESCAQYVAGNITFDPDAIYLHFGPSIAPGGYAWVFPKGVGVANVGLGVVTLRGDGRTARAYLDDFVARYFPGATVTGLTVGGVITGVTVKRTVTDGLILAGDAAHMINPLSGGGIITAMKAGRLAGRHAARALREGDVSAAGLQPYHEEWMALLGRAHEKYYKLKEALHRYDDDFFNRLARTVNRVPKEKRTLARVMASALVHHPTLIPVAAQLLVQEFC